MVKMEYVVIAVILVQIMNVMKIVLGVISMKSKRIRKGKIDYLLIELEENDLPRFSLLKAILCFFIRHKWKEYGGLATFVYFPEEIEKTLRPMGNAGCYAKVCQRCGIVERHGIWSI